MTMRVLRIVWLNRQDAFALPTIVIATVVMFMVLVAVVSSVSSARVALDSQYYEALMKDAGESGITYATDCMARNNGIVTWSSSKPLTSSTDCNGNTLSQCSAGCYLVNTPTLKVTFSVGSVTALSSGNYKMQSTGVVNL